MKCIVHARIYDFVTYIEDGYILFSDVIHEVGLMGNMPKFDCEIIDGTGKIVLPGLVCGHTHLYSAFARGLSLPFSPRNFQEILDQLWWKLDRSLDLEMVYYSGIAFASDFLKNGVTTIIDHHASGEITGSLEQLKKAVVDTAHLRGIFCFETSDRFDTSKCIDENNHFINNNHNEFTSGLFGLHASMTLSDDTLQRVSKETTAPIHIHVAESMMDQDDSIAKYHKRIVNRLNDFGLLRKESLFVHGIFLNEQELNLIKKNDVTVCVNVSSNMNNGVGLAPVCKFLEKGINVIIGNDGLSPSMANEYLSLYYAMHLQSKSPNLFTLDDVLQIIINTYDYTSHLLKMPLGQIKKHYVADMLILPYESITEVNKSNIFGHLFYGLFNSFKPETVIIAGNIEVSNYKVSKDLSKAINTGKSVSKACWKKLQKEGI
ncbi:MAG: amidohydrolase family protein [Candidatus Izemoplasmatales bacterium]|jgi:cytosine/adenosine deaminase-related metal-dependent hydrolase|nr:amidohydrolase family protein [Candidatus Izemoplasmatales bacterium]